MPALRMGSPEGPGRPHAGGAGRPDRRTRSPAAAAPYPHGAPVGGRRRGQLARGASSGPAGRCAGPAGGVRGLRRNLCRATCGPPPSESAFAEPCSLKVLRPTSRRLEPPAPSEPRPGPTGHGTGARGEWGCRVGAVSGVRWGRGPTLPKPHLSSAPTPGPPWPRALLVPQLPLPGTPRLPAHPGPSRCPAHPCPRTLSSRALGLPGRPPPWPRSLALPGSRLTPAFPGPRPTPAPVFPGRPPPRPRRLAPTPLGPGLSSASAPDPWPSAHPGPGPPWPPPLASPGPWSSPAVLLPCPCPGPAANSPRTPPRAQRKAPAKCVSRGL